MVHAAHQTLAGLHPSDVVLDTSGVAHLLSLRLTATLAHHPSIRASLGEAAVPRDYFADHPDLQELPDTQRDVLSVGLLLCFLLLGEIPDPAAWRTQNMEQTITQTRPDDAASLAQLAALMLSPADSPTSILEFAKLLERWLADNQA